MKQKKSSQTLRASSILLLLDLQSSFFVGGLLFAEEHDHHVNHVDDLMKYEFLTFDGQRDQVQMVILGAGRLRQRRQTWPFPECFLQLNEWSRQSLLDKLEGIIVIIIIIQDLDGVCQCHGRAATANIGRLDSSHEDTNDAE